MEVPAERFAAQEHRAFLFDAVERVHEALYLATREAAGREASPTAAIIDSQSAKAAQKGGSRRIRKASTRARKSWGANVTSSSIR